MAKYAVDFDTMDAVVRRYLKLYKHWPATYRVLPQNERSYITYHILPDAADTNNKERLGDIEISKIPGGTLLEFKEGYAQEREPTYEELRVLRHVEKAAASRLRPDNYDGDDEEQFAALRSLVESDREVRLARLDLLGKLNDEVLARYSEFEARMEEVKAGLLGWLAEHGIEPVAGGEGEGAFDVAPHAAGSQPGTVVGDIGLPTRSGNLRKWKEVWKLHGNSWTEGSPLTAIADALKRHNISRRASLPTGEDTLRKIFRAGEAGRLN